MYHFFCRSVLILYDKNIGVTLKGRSCEELCSMDITRQITHVAFFRIVYVCTSDTKRELVYLIKVCLTKSGDLSVFVLFFLFKVCLTQSADLSVFVLFFLFFYYTFLFSFQLTCVSRFLPYFSINLDEIWHVDSPWWDEQTEYYFKSIRPGVGTGRGPKVLLCFIIGKTLYTVRRDKNFT